jgi:hypothetical protein
VSIWAKVTQTIRTRYRNYLANSTAGRSSVLVSAEPKQFA